MKDPYDVLGLRHDVGIEEIKKAYRNLARRYHPDLDRGNPRAEDSFKEITAAYELLSDSKQKARYDRGDIDADGKPASGRSGRARAGGHRQRQGGGFGSTRKTGKASSIKINGADVEYTLKIGFLESVKGGVKQVNTTNGKHLNVTISPGIGDGRVLRLKGQGMPGFGGGKPGDALVEIRVNSDPVFNRTETDIHMDLAVSLPEAVLGSRVEVDTLDGPVSVTVPPNSNTGTILRLKGKGLALDGKSGGERGDQYVTLKVVLPSKPDDELVEFVRTWVEGKDYTVRPKKQEA